MGTLVIHRPALASPARLARWSTTALDDELHGDGRLVVAVPSGDAIVLGSYQRRSELAAAADALPVYRRGSGGGAVRVGPGSVWVQLALAQPAALIACDAPRVLNRYVRPLLRALGKASYFGRDWVSVAHRPAAVVGFAHDSATGRVLFEAIVSVTTPLPVGDRASFRGKAPATLAEISGHAIEPEAIAQAVVDAYERIAVATPGEPASLAASDAPSIGEEPPWSSTVEEAIGIVAAGIDPSGRMRVGGELMVSRDALAALEDALARGEDASAAVDASLGASSAVLFGVRSLASIRDVILAASKT